MYFFSKDKIRATNLKCLFKTDVKSDGSPPRLRLELNDEERSIIFKLDTLTTEEALFQFNKLTLPLVKEVNEVITESKGAKARKK